MDERRKGYPETDESGQFWRATMIDADTRLRVARGVGKTETDASTEVFQSNRCLRGYCLQLGASLQNTTP
jgi:hypothetical protein